MEVKREHVFSTSHQRGSDVGPCPRKQGLNMLSGCLGEQGVVGEGPEADSLVFMNHLYTAP